MLATILTERSDINENADPISNAESHQRASRPRSVEAAVVPVLMTVEGWRGLANREPLSSFGKSGANA